MKAIFKKGQRLLSRLMFLIVVFLLANSQQKLFAQIKMGDNPNSINPASVLELESTNKGLLISRIDDTTLINALNPPLGMLILINNAQGGTDLGIRTATGWSFIQNANQIAAKYALPSFTTGSVLFKGVNNISQDNANFKYDSTNKILTVAGGISSSVSGATVSYGAFTPLTNFPRAHMNIGNSGSDNNVGFVVAPLFSSAGVQKTAFWEVSTNKLASDAGDKDLLIMVSSSQSIIGSYSNNKIYPNTYAGNPIFFQIQPAGSAVENTGLIINNDANNTVTVGSNSIYSTAQLNVLHRSSLAAAWFDNKISIGANAGNTGQLLLNGATSGTVTLQSAATAGTWSLTVPVNAGSNKQVLQTDGNGVTSWANAILPSDTATMLTYYAKSKSLDDSIKLVNTAIQARLQLADTAAMLANYRNNLIALNADTATLISRFNTKLNLGDTANMLLNYKNNIVGLTSGVDALNADTATLISRFNTKLNLGDTANMLLNYKNNIVGLTSSVDALNADTATLISRFNTKLNLGDTANMLLNYKNNIVGLASGVSALNADTATLTARFNSKLNVSDTTGMLSSYKSSISSLTTNVTALNADTATLIARFNAKVNIKDTASMLSGYARITPIVSSVVPGATVTYTAFNPATNYPRGHMNIGNSNSDVNAGFVVAPLFSSTGTQKPSFFEVSTNKAASDAGDKDLLLMVNATQSIIGSYSNNKIAPYSFAGNPIYFNIHAAGSTNENSGLIVNNDASNTVTLGSNSASTTAQLNVLHRSSLPAAWFDNKISIGANAGTTGQIQLNGATSGTVTVQPATTAGTWSLTLPGSTGTNGQVLQTDGSGVTTWATVSSGGGAGVQYTDTASMLSPYARTNSIPSFAGKLNVSDTASMLSHYANVNSIPSVTGKLNISDTSAMLTNYRTGINTLTSSDAAKLNISDTASMLSHYAKIPSVSGKLNISDTASMLSAYAKTASIVSATNSLVTTSSTSYSVLTSDKYVVYTGSAIATFTLPTAVGVSGKEYIIKNMTAYNVTINTTSSQQIWQDAGTKTTSASLGVESQNNWIKLVSDGTEWIAFRALY